MSRWRTVSVFLVASLLAVVPLLAFGWQAAAEAEREVARGRLQLVQLAATQADHILMEAFFEVELEASRVFGAVAASQRCLDRESLAPVDGRRSNFSTILVVLACDGEVIFTESEGEDVDADRDAATGVFAAAARATDRHISEPFISPSSGHRTVGLSLPLFGQNGARAGTIVGLMDLEQHFSTDLIDVARQLGSTGHADLIGEGGVVLASTRHAQGAIEGEHPSVYREMESATVAAVRRTEYVVSSADGAEPRWHIMAYSPLDGAPWGVAIGASEAETLETANRLRRTTIRLGIAAAAAVAVGAGLLAFAVPRRGTG